MSNTTSNFLSTNAVHIAAIDGNECKSKEDFFTKTSAALQFPDYFGNNWDSFSECLCDCSWITQKKILIVISNADKLFNGDESDTEVFQDIMETAEDEMQSSKRELHWFWL